MKTTNDLAELIFKGLSESTNDLDKRFPKRNLKENEEITRFAPSPTGFLHTGSLFTALIDRIVALHSNGIFYLRLEDTDTKREICGSGTAMIGELQELDITIDEGYLGDYEKGIYGPYIQSKRENIYKIVIKEMIKNGLAYPCFCTEEDLTNIRKGQEANKKIPGYYGEYAKCRNLSIEQAYQNIVSGIPYVIRFKSPGNHMNKIRVQDKIRGTIEIAENDLDIVILKSDGLPTYHFAHVVDDHYMHTTLIIRGEEWISSLPIHIQLFDALNWEKPRYAHLPVIMKLENGNKRKLSKRKDKEAAVSYFLKQGYPKEAIVAYLLSIANSNFEDWFVTNNFKKPLDFPFSFQKMSLDGALFDEEKLLYFAREILARLSAEEITDNLEKYAKQYDIKLYNLIKENREYFISIMNIERNKPNPRKDYDIYSKVFSLISFFFHDEYIKMLNIDAFNPSFDEKTIINLLKDIGEHLNGNYNEQEWFDSLKESGRRCGFALSNKDYKANPSSYLGHPGDVAEILRIALTTRKQSPNLYYVMKVLGNKEIIKRLDIVSEKLLH